MWGMHDGMGWWFLYGGVSMAVFWALVIGVIIWAASRFTSRNPENNEEAESPLDIAKKRLARGEINEDEFEKIVSLVG